MCPRVSKDVRIKTTKLLLETTPACQRLNRAKNWQKEEQRLPLGNQERSQKDVSSSRTLQTLRYLMIFNFRQT